MPRAYGSGSKRERRKGVWELRAAGRSVTFRGTGKEAELELSKMIARYTNRTGVVAATFGDLLDEWWATSRLERSTRATYEHALAHLPADVRRLKLAKLTLRTFDRLYARLVADGVSVHQVRKLHVVLSSALTAGVRWQWLDLHPARGAHAPSAPERLMELPAAAALKRLLAVARSDDQTHAWIRLALATGMRRGELCALRWSRVDLDAGKISIGASLDKWRSEKATKTLRVRYVQLDPETVAVLSTWRTAQVTRALAAEGVQLARDPFVLSNTADSATPWRPDGMTQRWARLRTRAELAETTRLHDLRHTHVSLLLAAGIPVGDVAPRVGHSRTSTTQDRYGHLVDGADRRAATSIGEALGRLSGLPNRAVRDEVV